MKEQEDLEHAMEEKRKEYRRFSRECHTTMKCVFSFFVAFLIWVGIMIILPHLDREFQALSKWYNDYYQYELNNPAAP